MGKTVSIISGIIAISFMAAMTTIIVRHGGNSGSTTRAPETSGQPRQKDAIAPASTTTAPVATPPSPAAASSSATTAAPQGSAETVQAPATKPTAPVAAPPVVEAPAPAVSTQLPFLYTFNAPGILYESSHAARSASRYWFLDSGAELVIANGHGGTIQGSLPENDPWREAYALSSPTDTDQGYHPQNLFRLLTLKKWGDAVVQSDFLITADHLSASENRNESNGLLLMTRYQDHDTLYYAGIRVDGQAVIKKKYHGTYYTLAITPIYPGAYDRTTNPDLIPHDTWIGLRSEARNLVDGSVLLELSIEEPGSESWQPLLSVHDDGSFGGTPPITAAGTAGIRTDFMDVLFRNFRIDPICFSCARHGSAMQDL